MTPFAKGVLRKRVRPGARLDRKFSSPCRVRLKLSVYSSDSLTEGMSRNVTVGKPAGGVGNTGGATEGTVGGGGAVRGSGTTGSGGSNGGGAEGIGDGGGVGRGTGTPGGVVVGCPGSAAGVAGRSRDPRGGAAWASAAHGLKTKSKSTSSGAHLIPLLARGPTLLEEPLGNRDDVVWLQSHVAFG